MEYVLIVILGLAVLYFLFKRRGSRDCEVVLKIYQIHQYSYNTRYQKLSPAHP
jgi:hypothetical protein